MKRFVRYLVIFAATLTAALIVALVFAGIYFTDERILAAVRPQLEARLNRTLQIKSAELSFWGGIGVRLEGITVGNAAGFARPHLLSLENLEVKVRFWPLLSGAVVTDRVLIGPGELSLEIDAMGRNNWSELTKPDTTAGAEPTDGRRTADASAGLPPIPLAGNMEFRAINLSLDDYQKERSIELTGLAGQLTLSADFDLAQASASGEFSLAGGEIRTVEQNWDLAAAQLRLEFDLQTELPPQRIELSAVTLELFGLPITAQGWIAVPEENVDYQFMVAVEAVEFEQVTSRLPDTLWQSFFPTGPPSGSLTALLTIKPPEAENPYPRVGGKIQVSGLAGKYGAQAIPFAAPALEIRINENVLSVSAPALSVAEVPVSVTLTIDHPQAPNFSVGLSGEFDLARLEKLIDPATKVELGGTIEYAVSAFGAVKKWRGLQVNGHLDFHQVFWRSPEDTLTALDELSGRIKLAGGDAKIENLRLRSGPSSMEIDGHLTGLVPYLIHLGKDIQRPHLQCEIRAPYLDLDRLTAEEAESQTSTGKASDPQTPMLPLIDLTAEGQLVVDSAVYAGVPLHSITGKLSYADWVMRLSDLRGRVYGGKLTGDAEVDFSEWDEPAFKINTKASGIEANDFITDFTGFGGHLFGKINLEGQFAGRGEEAADIVRSLTARGEMAMIEGKFESFNILSSLGRQAGISGITESGPIKDMSTSFWIENGRLYNQDWKFTSGGTDYLVVGSVGFDGSLDYRVQIDLPQAKGGGGLLSALGDLFGDAAGGVTLNLALGGTYDQPTVKIDSRQNLKNFEKNMKTKAGKIFDRLRQQK